MAEKRDDILFPSHPHFFLCLLLPYWDVISAKFDSCLASERGRKLSVRVLYHCKKGNFGRNEVRHIIYFMGNITLVSSFLMVSLSYCVSYCVSFLLWLPFLISRYGIFTRLISLVFPFRRLQPVCCSEDLQPRPQDPPGHRRLERGLQEVQPDGGRPKQEEDVRQVSNQVNKNGCNLVNRNVMNFFFQAPSPIQL